MTLQFNFSSNKQIIITIIILFPLCTKQFSRNSVQCHRTHLLISVERCCSSSEVGYVSFWANANKHLSLFPQYRPTTTSSDLLVPALLQAKIQFGCGPSCGTREYHLTEQLFCSVITLTEHYFPPAPPPQMSYSVLKTTPCTKTTIAGSKIILNRQTFKALPACELIKLISLVSSFYAGSALNVWRFNIDPPGCKHNMQTPFIIM